MVSEQETSHTEATSLYAPSGAAAAVPTAKPQKTGRGGVLGQIPINYASAKTRTGWYYLPKVLAVQHAGNVADGCRNRQMCQARMRHLTLELQSSTL